ncbi:MAG: signal peptide peptidase SppA [Parvularculaceae bacterium]|nr:signal peptide peptidase SppA [Parvularculaceae bacterium]
MAEEENRPSVWGFIKGFGKLIVGILLILQGVVGLALVLLLVGLFSGASNFMSGGGGPVASVPQDAALLINPNGVLVEEAELSDPFEQAFQQAYGAEEPSQIEVGEMARAIREAAKDDRIKAIVLDLTYLYIPEISASKAHYLAAALDEFKTSGKKIYAIGDYYSQEQYILAAHADEIYLHDKGSLVLVGYGAYDGYVKSFLEKILVTPHVFRVGTFKAAVEPFLRDDMSPEAKEANLAFLGSMWTAYKTAVEKARGLPAGTVDRFSNDFNGVLRETSGDLAQAALKSGFVDKLANRIEQKKAMIEAFGEDKDNDAGFKSVELSTYLAALGPVKDGKNPNVAIVTAAGTIVDGDALPGVAAGGDTVAANLKTALEDDDVKAVVLRIDSPGGSAFASEIIRDGVLELKAAGKPVVVSMGSLAASGGYWIAAPGDEIWASPTTVTGSIGIFAFFPTFERAAEYWGINIDGVGTTALSSIYAAGVGPLEPNVADIFQQSVEAGYRDFIDVVSEGRKLDAAYVDSVGQGRVWIGDQAKGLKLVDNLGDIDEAVAAAAKRANLTDYDRVEVREQVTPFELFFGHAAVKAMKLAGFEADKVRGSQTILRKVIGAVEDKARFFNEFNDPGALYARCMTCGG